MGDELSLGYKIAAGACILAFILSIVVTLMAVGRNFWNQTADAITQPVTAVQDTDAFFLASYGSPVPVASIWKLTERINGGFVTSVGGNGNIQTFAIKERNPSNPNAWVLRSTNLEDLDDYMDRKAYLSWSVDESTGLYSMEVLVV